MRCKKHPADASSGVGVCASCLRERLFAIIAAQAQSQTHPDSRKSAADPPPLLFPRSVSPYISRRKSDTAASSWRPHQVHHQRFFSTPQVGPTTVEFDKGIGIGIGNSSSSSKKKGKGARFSSLFFGLFRSKSVSTDSGPGPNPGNSCSVSSPSWFSTNFVAGRRAKKSGGGAHQRRIGKDRDRGMSPARYSDEEEEHAGPSGYSSETSHGWKQTPRSTPASARRGGGKAAAANVPGLKFCLSPLVRASPGRHWNQKGVQSEMLVSGESRVSAKPYLSVAASFCKNRSRKLADIGRYN